MYERLTERQKDLLKDIVIGVREDKVEEPFQGTCYISGECYIDGLKKSYEPSLIVDLKILEQEELLSSVSTSRGGRMYNLFQTAYDADDSNFQEHIQKLPLNIRSDEAFIICAFRDELEPVCDIIKTASAKFDIEAHRVNEHEDDFKITEKIIQDIEQARIIFADLSFGRPNVYFEYVYARGVGRTGCIITLIKKGEDAHFDVKDWNQIVYDPDNLSDLEEKLEKRISSLLNKQES
jgi:hypothetical protein